MTAATIAPVPDTDPGPVPAEPEQDWVFTFGHGHRAVSVGHSRPDPATEPQGRGFPLFDRYVVIKGTHESARARMVEIFGQVWSWQYPSLDEAGVHEFGLTELVMTHDTRIAW